MARAANTCPTNIYWLFDIRPETLVGWPEGRPFYCGKTVAEVGDRFKSHRVTIVKYPKRPVSQWLVVCGKHVRFQIMEIVPAIEDWVSREEFWIRKIRLIFPDGANISKGGAGPAGVIRSPKTRAKMSLSKTGTRHSIETKDKIGIAQIGRQFSLEHRAKLSVKASAAHARRRAERNAMAREPTEFDIQRAFTIFYKGEKWRQGPQKAQWKALPHKLPGVVAWHTPNGGTRQSAFEGMRLNEIGLEAGIPDYFFLWGGLYFLEFKKPGGVLSPAQLRMHPLLTAAGAVGGETVDNLADAKAFVIRHGLTLPDV